MYLKHILTAVYILMYSILLSQSKHLTTYHLDEVTVIHRHLKKLEIGLKKNNVDSFLIDHAHGLSLSELFRMGGFNQIRSYGTHGVSTPSFRGTAGSHTAILWNGINLQSPLSGVIDLSLIPTGFLDNVILQKGGSSVLYGSGAIGGTIQLENQVNFDRGLSIQLRLENRSFDHYITNNRISWSNKNIESTTSFFYRKLKNDYPYKNIYVRPQREEIRQNAGLYQRGILQQNNFKINNHQSLGFKIWYQFNHFEIPSSIFATESLSEQVDAFLRNIVFWDYQGTNINLNYQFAYFNHDLGFKDPIRNIDSNIFFESWVNKGEAEWKITDIWSMLSNVRITHHAAKRVTNYGNNQPSRNEMSFFTSLKYDSYSQNLKMALNLREEWVGSEWQPFIPSVGIDYKLSPNINILGNVSKNFRLPTFNDLYWKGEGATGNIHLKPELSWNAETGTKLNFFSNNQTTQYNFSTTFYTTWVENWILWYPQNSGVWTPKNIKKVWSRGIDFSFITISKLFQPFVFQYKLDYELTKVTNITIEKGGNAKEINKQLLYTPMHVGSATLGMSYKYINWTWIYSYTGKQYTDGENTEIFSLPAYGLINTYFNITHQRKSTNYTISISINNLFNVTYENRRGYPLYGKNYSIGLNIVFNSKYNK